MNCKIDPYLIFIAIKRNMQNKSTLVFCGRSFITIYLVLFPILSYAGSDSVPAVEDCESSQFAINVCAVRSFNIADKKLNELFQRQSANLKNPSTKGRLRAAQ